MGTLAPALDRVRALLIECAAVDPDRALEANTPMAKNFKVSFTLDEADANYFRSLYRTAKSRTSEE